MRKKIKKIPIISQLISILYPLLGLKLIGSSIEREPTQKRKKKITKKDREKE